MNKSESDKPIRVQNNNESSCPYFKKCGSCHFSSESYAEELKIKSAQTAEILGSAAKKSGCSPDEIVGSATPLFYRNKVHSVFSRDKKGNVIRGQYQEDSHKVVPVSGCLLEDRDADAVIEEIRKLCPSFKIRIYDEDTGFGLLRHVLVRVGEKNGRKQMMVVFVTSEPQFPSRNNLVKVLVKKFPMITTVVQNINPKRTSMVLGDRNVVIYGKGYIEDDRLGLTFRISPDSFYQINSAQTKKLYSLALEAAGLTGKEKVLDAYCGTGTIGMFMAPYAESVVGVELNRNAVKDAVSNARGNKLSNIRFVNADATQYMEEAAKAGEHIDVLCMDPPRTGSTPQFIDAAASLKIPRIVYVSCDQETLARDLRLFEGRGYTIGKITPVDMFPRTRHIETVVLISLQRH